MQLAKPALDIGLYTNNVDAMLAFWQEQVHVEFSELLKVGGGLHQYPAQIRSGRRVEHDELVKHWLQSTQIVARCGEVIPHGKQDVDIVLQRQSPEQRSETVLVFSRIQGKQLFELIDDDQSPCRAFSPPCDCFNLIGSALQARATARAAGDRRRREGGARAAADR